MPPAETGGHQRAYEKRRQGDAAGAEDAMDAQRTGTVMAHKKPNGFRWCYIERKR